MHFTPFVTLKPSHGDLLFFSAVIVRIALSLNVRNNQFDLFGFWCLECDCHLEAWRECSQCINNVSRMQKLKRR